MKLVFKCISVVLFCNLASADPTSLIELERTKPAHFRKGDIVELERDLENTSVGTVPAGTKGIVYENAKCGGAVLRVNFEGLQNRGLPYFPIVRSYFVGFDEHLKWCFPKVVIDSGPVYVGESHYSWIPYGSGDLHYNVVRCAKVTKKYDFIRWASDSDCGNITYRYLPYGSEANSPFRCAKVVEFGGGFIRWVGDTYCDNVVD